LKNIQTFAAIRITSIGNTANNCFQIILFLPLCCCSLSLFPSVSLALFFCCCCRRCGLFIFLRKFHASFVLFSGIFNTRAAWQSLSLSLSHLLFPCSSLSFWLLHFVYCVDYSFIFKGRHQQQQIKKYKQRRLATA